MAEKDKARYERVGFESFYNISFNAMLNVFLLIQEMNSYKKKLKGGDAGGDDDDDDDDDDDE